MTMSKQALVVEGGAMRGVFASGVLDSFLEHHYDPFDFYMGVSAGASNLIGYLANQPKRSIKIITQLATDKHFYNPTRFLRGGDLTDVHWLVEQSFQQYPIDMRCLSQKSPLFAATTNVNTGLAEYHQINADNLQQAIEATSALPIAYRSTPSLNGQHYTDGGVADSIPVQEAYRRGAKSITVVLSRPQTGKKPSASNPWLWRRLLRRHPALATAMINRAKRYQASLDFIQSPPHDCQINVISPDSDFKVKRLTMNPSLLEQGYQQGLQRGLAYLDS